MNEALWQSFLSRQDMRWRRLPGGWDDGPWIGNGRLGAILWQKDSAALHIEVSRGDLYDHRRRDGWGMPVSALFAACRLPNGHFELAWPDADVDGAMRLDLWNAEISAELRAGDEAWRMQCYAHAQRDVIVLRLTGRGRAPVLRWHPDRAASTRTARKPEGLHVEPYPPQTLHEESDGVSASVQHMPEDRAYHTEGCGEGQYATAWTARTDPDGITYTLSTRLSYPGAGAADEAMALVRDAAAAEGDALREEHRRWWHDYYRRSLISIPDAKLESFYWIQVYKMACCSRRGGPVTDLMGPWFAPTHWPAIWWNLNIQLTYWPFYMANHLAEAEPLIETLWRQRDHLAANAAPHSADSYAIGRASGLDCVCRVGPEIGNLPWVMHNLWLHYRSSMDDRLLGERLFPLMKGSFRYLHHLLETRPDGTLALPEAASPEYVDAVESCSYALACLRWLAGTIIAADERLEAGDPIVDDCRKVLDKLEPYPIDEATGLMVGRDMPLTRSHRHWSHLFMIYPFGEYTWDQPERVDLLETSLKTWTDMPEKFTGYSWLGAAAMHAAAGRGDEALAMLRTFLARSPLPNTLYRESSPVIETPLACARVVQEMLMTSGGGLIRIFPGIPTSWDEAVFADLRAEGAFLVSARRRAGRTCCVRIASEAGEPCRVRTGLAEPIQATGRGRYRHDSGTGITEIDLAQGQSITLHTAGAMDEPAFEALDADAPGWSWGGCERT